MAEPRRTPDVELEVLRAEHADALFERLCNPTIYRFLDEDPPTSLEWLRRRFEQLSAGAPEGVDEVWLNWVVRRGESVVGTTQATVRADGVASIGYVLVVEAWGSGIGRSAVEMTLARLGSEHGVSVVQAEIDPQNQASIRLVEALGFEDGGTIGDDRRFVRRLPS